MRGFLTGQLARGGVEAIGMLAMLLAVAAIAGLGLGIALVGFLALGIVFCASLVQRDWQIEVLLGALAVCVTAIAVWSLA